MTIEIDFLQKKSIDSNPYDTDKMAAEFIQQFNSQAFSVGQQVGGALAAYGSMRHACAQVCDVLKKAEVLQRGANGPGAFPE